MATETIQVSAFIPAPPMKVYTAWLSSEEHTAFTGGEAECEDRVGGKFTAWDEYISGTNQELLEGRMIVQSWRTTEFPKNAPDSVLTVHFDPNKDGTQLTILHTEIPEGQGRDYESGWFEYYLEPMQKYFAKGGAKTKATAKKTAAKKPVAKKKAAPAKKAPAKKKGKK
ncbi:MAG TPA: SRPBCC domain-containing protein [Myxococcales bacterium]|jgi:uncharacterized protein YndB with AHSA1/START domain